MNYNTCFKGITVLSKFKTLIIAIILGVFVFGCKTASIFEFSYTPTTQYVQLGNLGSSKDFILQQGYNNRGIPHYKTPIKLTITNKLFTKQNYKTFAKAKALQSANVDIKYVDSIVVKPYYVQLQIADQITLIESLNNQENKGVKGYLMGHSTANLITSVSMAFNQNDLNKIKQAEAAFLVEHGLKTYAIQLYNDGKKAEIIPFNKGVVFGYDTAYCCWQEDNKHRMQIIGLVNEFNQCPYNTYRNSKRAKKQDKLF